MNLLKAILVRLADKVDHHVFQHNYYEFCWDLSMHPWWDLHPLVREEFGDGEYAYERAKTLRELLFA